MKFMAPQKGILYTVCIAVCCAALSCIITYSVLESRKDRLEQENTQVNEQLAKERAELAMRVLNNETLAQENERLAQEKENLSRQNETMKEDVLEGSSYIFSLEAFPYHWEDDIYERKNMAIVPRLSNLRDGETEAKINALLYEMYTSEELEIQHRGHLGTPHIRLYTDRYLCFSHGASRHTLDIQQGKEVFLDDLVQVDDELVERFRTGEILYRNDELADLSDIEPDRIMYGPYGLIERCCTPEYYRFDNDFILLPGELYICMYLPDSRWYHVHLEDIEDKLLVDPW